MLSISVVAWMLRNLFLILFQQASEQEVPWDPHLPPQKKFIFNSCATLFFFMSSHICLLCDSLNCDLLDTKLWALSFRMGSAMQYSGKFDKSCPSNRLQQAQRNVHTYNVYCASEFSSKNTSNLEKSLREASMIMSLLFTILLCPLSSNKSWTLSVFHLA